MTPEERQLLSGMFDRIRGAANQPRDREAETLITDAVRSQPYAPYLLSQTVIVQEQALRAASERIQQLEAQVQQGAAQPEDSSFLGSIGKSIFGAGPSSNQGTPGRQSVSTTGGHGPGPLPQEPHPYNTPQQAAPSGPWGQQASVGGWAGANQAGAPQGGGFLKGALGAAAGVAGGVLLADSIRGLFGGHNNPFGIASGGMGGMGGMGGFGAPGGETVVNNYYDSPNPGSDAVDPGSYDDAQQDFLQDASDDFGNDSIDPGSNGDDSYNV